MTVKIEQKTQDLGGPYDIYELYLHLREKRETEYSFFFESVKEETKEPLYSYICLDPDLFIQIDNEKLSFPKILTARGEKFLEKMNQLDYQEIQNEKNLDDRVDYDVKSLDMLSNIFSDLKSKLPSNFSRQVFYGGLLGYIGWDVLSTWVGFDKKSRIPDILLGLHTRVLIYDHKQTKLYMVDNVPDKISEPQNFSKNLESYDFKKPKIINQNREYIERGKSTVKKEEFMSMVDKVKDYIYDGEILQAVISRRIDVNNLDIDDLVLYGVLREINPSPYMYHMDFGDQKFVGSSPEALLTVNDSKLVTVPIAGTRKRGKNKKEDEKMERELIEDTKERAEHVMLVDLARNDLAKVSEADSVKTTTFMEPRKYRHVMHLVSVVESRLRRGLDSFDALKSCFPAGTVSGAPKLRAMEIIEELERYPRDAYAGVTGYMSFNMNADWAISIRMMNIIKNNASIQVGAGIVADSDPELEWIETENKARSLLRAISIADDI